MARTLIFGAGWIGTVLAEGLDDAVVSRADIADPEAVRREIARVDPKRVVNAAGKTGRPNIDSCEADPAGTYRSNVVGPIVLASVCRERDLHLTHLSSGCIYQGDAGGRGWSEEDPPNFSGSLYSRTKTLAEAALVDLGALQLRLRLPLSSRPHPRNLLTKLLSFPSVVSIPNSVTVLEDFLPVARALIERRETGIWNLVNDGVERHDELLALWRDLVEPGRRIAVVRESDLAGRVRVPRSHCVLSTTKLHGAGLALPPLSESLPRLVRDYARAIGADLRPAGRGR